MHRKIDPSSDSCASPDHEHSRPSQSSSRHLHIYNNFRHQLHHHTSFLLCGSYTLFAAVYCGPYPPGPLLTPGRLDRSDLSLDDSIGNFNFTLYGNYISGFPTHLVFPIHAMSAIVSTSGLRIIGISSNTTPPRHRLFHIGYEFRTKVLWNAGESSPVKSLTHSSPFVGTFLHSCIPCIDS